jgi:carboxymethylenebutenolidase
MNKTNILLPSIFLLCFFTACNSSQENNSTSSDNMAQFTKDEKFNETHEIPTNLTFVEKGKPITYETPDGKTASAYFLKSAEKSDKFLFVIHEWWGLNDHIKQEAEMLFEAIGNVNVMALDLYDGNVATSREDAGKFMKMVTDERAKAIITGALAFAGKDAKVATIGWCFGGGWSLKSSVLAGDQGIGCVIYYGMPVQKADQLVNLKAEVLGLFAEKDGWITPEVVNNFEAIMKATGKTVTTKQFDAEHAFANPSSPRYKESAAQEANAMALKFLKEKLM